ncbi:MAG TPA: SDR family oxidoreductase [Propionicimonas sp.]|nr:SDR family oxidoreductase [Propionicimonas sp.]HQA78300.1 SDR family oxidoreductase [Propionicimonas sp.]HQD96934.1 SDR family oxidoreductase [Propionicimonas sp.]
MQLDGARFLITGGGSGLGRQLALQAAARGAHVEVWDLDAAAAAATTEITGGTSQRVDVTDTAAVDAAAAAAGAIDVLVNCAGIVSGKSLLDASEAAIRRTFEVNTLAGYWTTRAFLPGMLDRDRGTIVTLASAAGLVGVARQTDYSASKWAAIGFTESLRAELRASGSQVSTLVVAPYYIDTGMFAGVRTRVPLLLPILKEAKVATQILDAIASGRQQLVLPPLARVVPALRVLPVRAFDVVMDLFGINHTMDHFIGRGR